jgi:hypothetical protein
MSPELQQKLFAEFPTLFEHRSNRMYPMAFGIEHGDGWYGILRAACFLIARHDAKKSQPEFRFTQVKEKFGALRLYNEGFDDYTDGVIKMAESMSAVTCEQCGSPGTQNKGGWISTLCEGCRK